MDKISIRFFNDKEVRAIWHNNKWYFSIVDVVFAITNNSRPRTYWGALKNRLKQNNNQLYSKCIQLKLASKDGKKYLTDCYPASDITNFAKNIPNKNTINFLNWFTYSDNTVDGQSKKKAYSFWESNLISDKEIGTTKALQKIHAYIFGGLYKFAGQIRTLNISKGGFKFANTKFLNDTLSKIENMPQSSFDEIVNKYIEMNIAHPFMEGNGRSTRIWLDLIFKKSLKKCIDWSKIDKSDYFEAMKESIMNGSKLHKLLKKALTNKINNREIFMKGIDYSYYYEQN